MHACSVKGKSEIRVANEGHDVGGTTSIVRELARPGGGQPQACGVGPQMGASDVKVERNHQFNLSSSLPACSVSELILSKKKKSMAKCRNGWRGIYGFE